MTFVNLNPEQKIAAQQRISQKLQVLQRKNARVISNAENTQRISTALVNQDLPTPIRVEFSAHRSLIEGLATGGDAASSTREYLATRGILQQQKREAKRTRANASRERTTTISAVLEGDKAVGNIDENFQNRGFLRRLFGDNSIQTAAEAHKSLSESVTELGQARKDAGRQLRDTLGITDKTQFRDPQIHIKREYDSATGKATEIKQYTFVKGDGTVVKVNGDDDLAKQYERFQEARFAHEEAKEKLDTFETEAKKYFDGAQLTEANREKVNRAFSELTNADSAEKVARDNLDKFHFEDGFIPSAEQIEQTVKQADEQAVKQADEPDVDQTSFGEWFEDLHWLGKTALAIPVIGAGAGLIATIWNWLFPDRSKR